MDMEASTVGSTKGKRTKRHRPFFSITHSTSSSFSTDDHYSSASTIDDEEEDMANCLILLAQSGDLPLNKDPPITKNISGFYVYECKTCNKTFPSFQALGGHRASHKKPKLEATASQGCGFEVEEAREDVGVNKGFHHGNKGKIHECSICGSEFMSGQALGGHMRRHRALMNNNTTAVEEVKPRNVLGLDLNLPAPESLVMSAPALVGCHY